MLLEKFKEVNEGPWTTGGLNVQYKVKDGTLYFECTSGESDWAFNLFASKVRYDEHGTRVTCHAGFAALWLSIRDEIEKLEFTEIVGYSEGEALASAAHLNYFLRKGVEPQTYAFAAPRYFSYKAWKSVKANFTKFSRIKNRNDIVTHVPMNSLGFKHVGKALVLKGKAKMPKGLNLFRWISGHSPEQYLQTLEGK